MRTIRGVSEQKLIVDNKTHESLLPKYLKLLDKLEEKFEVDLDPEYSELVNFEINKVLPIHRWFYYKQGYSDKLIEKLIKESVISSKSFIFDPFCGVGTTQITAERLSIKSIGLEINPIASFASEIKSMKFNKNEINEIKRIIRNIENYLQNTKLIPKYKKLHDIFTPSQLKQILKIKGMYEQLSKKKIQKFFKLAYIAIIEDCSNRKKDGNGIKISKNKKIIKNVVKYYTQKCNEMLTDLENKTYSVESHTFWGSILDDKIFRRVKEFPIELVIFSPPYANCFDYCEVSKMEIWMGGFVDEYSDFGKFREKAIRSHVNAKFDHKIMHSNNKVELIASLIGTYNIWNKNIPDMLRGYFDDMTEVLNRLYQLLKKGNCCYIVVANSSYKEIVVPTDLLLADIGENIGFKIKKIIHARNMPTSSQQSQKLSKNILLRESIILLEKNTDL